MANWITSSPCCCTVSKAAAGSSFNSPCGGKVQGAGDLVHVAPDRVKLLRQVMDRFGFPRVRLEHVHGPRQDRPRRLGPRKPMLCRQLVQVGQIRLVQPHRENGGAILKLGFLKESLVVVDRTAADREGFGNGGDALPARIAAISLSR